MDKPPFVGKGGFVGCNVCASIYIYKRVAPQKPVRLAPLAFDLLQKLCGWVRAPVRRCLTTPPEGECGAEPPTHMFIRFPLIVAFVQCRRAVATGSRPSVVKIHPSTLYFAAVVVVVVVVLFLILI